MSINVGQEFKMVFPFWKETIKFGNISNQYWNAGCSVHDEQYDQGRWERFYTANGEGTVIYKVLSIAEMTGKYMNRVIFHRHLIDPDGKKYNRGEVRILTLSLFNRDVESVTPFKAEYELENT